MRKSAQFEGKVIRPGSSESSNEGSKKSQGSAKKTFASVFLGSAKKS